eukprot:CAMPEP_0195527060 /NCGR_PEP_ID=MMETSP0794_2-20130614/28501_1 /TAXON_ID=515487 /ORGANISM="Stephanopyxis turris, Strain CCMP 815" /LENGTH=124 /DNA_ID=CAMNT_0040657883 /DNA_START=175 /DNA_END=546 /DNA_ORIENTATION=+
MRSTEGDYHQRFIAALESHGPGLTGKEWTKMAASMGGRSVEEVKLYAYRYMLSLQSTSRERPTMNGEQLESSLVAETSPTSYSDWSHDECILFETLLARYGSERDGGDDLRWERIAAAMGKTVW